MYPKFQPYLDRFIWDSIINFLQYFIAKQNLKITYSKTIVQAACKKLINRIAQKREVITVWDVHVKVIKRMETKVEKARKALD